MSLEATYIQRGYHQPYTPGTAKTAGEIVQLPDGRAAIVKTDLAASELGSVYSEGIFDVLCTSGTTWSAGDPVYWDASASVAITTPGASDDVLLGTAVDAVASGTAVRVDLNKGLAGAGGTGQRVAWRTRAQLIEHDDTAEHELVAAAENPAGLIILLATGIITEVMVGSSQDQQIVTVYDSDDTALATLTATDAAADAVGDLVQGTPTAIAATGTVLAVIPAGKGCYAKTSQATAGGTPAGSMRVGLLVAPLI